MVVICITFLISAVLILHQADGIDFLSKTESCIWQFTLLKFNEIRTLFCSLCLTFFHLRAQKLNLEKKNYSNIFFHNFRLSESSFTCQRLRWVSTKTAFVHIQTYPHPNFLHFSNQMIGHIWEDLYNLWNSSHLQTFWIVLEI